MADEFLRSSGGGRQTLTALDRAHGEGRSPLSHLPLVGGFFHDGDAAMSL